MADCALRDDTGEGKHGQAAVHHLGGLVLLLRRGRQHCQKGRAEREEQGVERERSRKERRREERSFLLRVKSIRRGFSAREREKRERGVKTVVQSLL